MRRLRRGNKGAGIKRLRAFEGRGAGGLGRDAAVAPNHLPRHVWWWWSEVGPPSPPVCMAAPFAEVWGSCQNQSKCCV